MIRLIAFLAASLLSCKAGLNDLEALSLIESGNNDAAVGGAGEVSRYQILPKVWRGYTRSRDYRNSWLAGDVARRHLVVLEQSFLNHTGRKPADFDLYVLWNAGLEYYRRHDFSPSRVHRIIRDRAARFANLKTYLRSRHSGEQASLAY